MATLSIQNVTKRYGACTAVSDFTLSVADGEFVSLLGPSGCGKTTLLRGIAGFFRIDSGAIRVGERLLSGNGSYVPPEQRNLGMVFQSYAVWPHMNVYHNIAYPLHVRNTPALEVRTQVERVLSLMNLMGQEKKNPSELSGGQQQRVALGRALVMEPDVLLLDEPLSNLDAKLRDRMRFELKEVQRRFNQTIIYVTHDQDEAMAVSDRIVLMSAGTIRQIGEPREIFHRPDNLFSARFIGRSNFITGTLVERGEDRWTVRSGDARVRIPVVPASHAATATEREVVIVVRYRDVKVLHAPSKATIPGTVVTSTYLGGSVLYAFSTDAGLLYAQVGDDHLFEEGARYHLKLSSAHVFPNTGEVHEPTDGELAV